MRGRITRAGGVAILGWIAGCGYEDDFDECADLYAGAAVPLPDVPEPPAPEPGAPPACAIDLREYLAPLGVPGLSAALITSEGVSCTAVAGFSDIEAGRAVSPTDAFDWASVLQDGDRDRGDDLGG